MYLEATMENHVDFIYNVFLYNTQMLKNFLIEAAGDYILLEHQENDSLTNNTRCALIRYMSELVTDLYGMTPTRDQKLMACKAAIYLFPSLRLKESGTDGTVGVNKNSISK